MTGAGPRRATAVERGITLLSLSHVNDPATTPIFPGDPAFVLETAATVAVDGYYLQYVREGEHTGTHWGAPAHFQEGGRSPTSSSPTTCSCRR